MACFHPLVAFRDPMTGGMTFDSRHIAPTHALAVKHFGMKLACGQCVGCRMSKSGQWAVRCIHEASLHKDNCFITLTYDNEHLPADGSLNVAHFQKFMKRLRQQHPKIKIRFFHCGEYGDQLGRPHYHALLFGLDFPDKLIYKKTKKDTLYNSEVLTKIWGHGFAVIGSLTFESAAYCARYIMKKINGRQQKSHYEVIDEVTGVITDLKPEYITMSRRPGVASGWFDKYHTDCYPSDFITHNGKKMRPPKFYDRLYEHIAPDTMAQIKEDRVAEMKLHKEDNTPERLAVRKACLLSRVSELKRPIHND